MDMPMFGFELGTFMRLRGLCASTLGKPLRMGETMEENMGETMEDVVFHGFLAKYWWFFSTYQPSMR